MELPDQMMSKIVELDFNYIRQADSENDCELELGQWKPLLFGAHWNGKILVQCHNVAEQKKLYNRIQGKLICINGVHKTLAVTSLALDSLGTDLLQPFTIPASN